MSGDPSADRLDAEGACCARCDRPVRTPRRKATPDPRGRVWVALKRWPEGLICANCFARSCEVYGVCARCRTDRLLPGIGPEGQRWCTDCAGLGNFTCSRCGQEGWLHSRGAVCGRCVLNDRLAVALDDGTGRVRPELVPLVDLVVGMERPRAGILWLSKPHVPPLLQAIAHGEVPLTHDGIATLSPVRSATYVRDLLVSAGVLPPVDRFLFHFEKWLPGWLAQVANPEHRQLLHAYATWRLLRDMRTIAAAGPIGHYRDQIARRQLRVAAAFLDVLSDSGLALEGCTQAMLDDWFAQATGADRDALRHFLRWARESRRMPRLRVPRQSRAAQR